MYFLYLLKKLKESERFAHWAHIPKCIGSSPIFNKIIYMLELNLNLSNSLFKNEYINILFILIMAIFISIIIILLSYFLVIQQPESEKLSSYECGFEPYDDARHKFDVQFYLIAILFVVFDIETMFLLPWSLAVSKLNLLGFWAMVDFIIELGICFIYIFFIKVLDFR